MFFVETNRRLMFPLCWLTSTMSNSFIAKEIFLKFNKDFKKTLILRKSISHFNSDVISNYCNGLLLLLTLILTHSFIDSNNKYIHKILANDFQILIL